MRIPDQMRMPDHRPLLRSFRFAWNGLTTGAIRERNLRLQLGLGVLAGAFMARAPLAPAERAVLALCVGAVVAAEAMNSAVEGAVDLASPRFDEAARVAKDAAAGAVLALAAGSALALLAIGGARLRELSAWARALPGLDALALAGAACAAAACTVFLPSPSSRSRAADLLLICAAAAGLVFVSIGARSHVGTATAALCLAVAAGGAVRRRARAVR